jgi:(p)ppGpp synthase/HD superfamily hydrolase
MAEFEEWERSVRRYARWLHQGQLDDSGEDYFKAHLAHVASLIKLVTSDKDLITAAYLHDSIEDTAITYKGLELTFNKRVADLVNDVTHEGKKDEWGYYFPRLHSKDGIILKLCDRLSNVSRMESWSKERQEQYLRKTKFWKSEGKP